MALAYFGKIPSRGDFVRLNGTDPSIRAFDTWIQNGFRQASSPLYRTFNDAYDNGGSSCFVFRPAGGHRPLVGAMHPSRDQAGRRYPFFVADIVDSVGPIPGYSSLFEWASNVVRQSASDTLSLEEITDIVNAGPTHSPSATPHQTTLGDLFSQAFGSFSDSGKYATFRNLIDLFEGGQPRFSYGLRFPIACGAGAIASMNFWIELCSILSRTTLESQSFFCNVDCPTEDGPTHLFLYFNQVAASGFFGPSHYLTDVESLYEIDSVAGRNPAEIALSIPEAVGTIIEDQSLSLVEAINRMRAISNNEIRGVSI